MKFEFAHPTDITKFAKERFAEYEPYESIYIVPDSKCYHILRVEKYKKHKDDETYSYDLVQTQVYRRAHQKLSINLLRYVLSEDVELEEIYDTYECKTLEEVHDRITEGNLYEIL